MYKNLWDKLNSELDEDERIVYPEMCINNPRLYDKIIGIAYLVKDQKDPKAELTWVWARGVERTLKKNKNMAIIAKQLIVRIRLPWNETQFEWTVSQAELDDNREDYTVIDIFLKVHEKGHPDDVRLLVNPLEFESNRNKYEVVEIRYLVHWKPSVESEERLLAIDPDAIHTVIST